MLKLQYASVTMSDQPTGKFCRVSITALDDTNPAIRLATEKVFNVNTDSEVQSFWIEFQKVVDALKLANGVS